MSPHIKSDTSTRSADIERGPDSVLHASVMSRGPRTILFLSHSATRNGASILLLHLLQWLRANTDFRLEVLSCGGGPLIDDFRAVASTHVWRNPLFFLRGLRQPWAMAWRSQLESWLLRVYLGRRHYDLIYANTAATWHHVAALERSADAVLWHIHELPYAIRLTMASDTSRHLLQAVTRVVAVSGPVVDSLTNQFSVAKDRVDLIHGFVPIPDVSEQVRQEKRQRILQTLGWPDDAFVVGGCGGLGWRKGTDLFLQIASRLQRSNMGQTMRFLWVGGGDQSQTEALQFEHDVHGLGLENVCQRLASTADVDDYYCAMDVFALSSREDPFPLVMLEAAMHGVSTICFAGAGGGPEFVADDAGMVVPYLDLDAFAHAISTLYTDPARRKALGSAAQGKARQQHSIASQGPKLLHSIERCLAQA